MRIRGRESRGALEMGESFGGLVGFEEGAAEPEVSVGVLRVRSGDGFEERDGFSGTGLADEELGVADSGFGVDAAGEVESVAVFGFGFGGASEGFERLGAGEAGAPVASVGVLQGGEGVVVAVEGVEGAGVEEARVGDFVIQAAGASERLFGFTVLLQGGVSDADGFPLLGVLRVGLSGAVEERERGGELAAFEEGDALFVVGGLDDGAEGQCCESAEQPAV